MGLQESVVKLRSVHMFHGECEYKRKECQYKSKATGIIQDILLTSFCRLAENSTSD